MPKVIPLKKESAAMDLIEITPEMARDWLEANFENRPVRETVILRYVQAMKSGQWEVNGETIKFSDKGVLLDGQHRLRAVVQSGVAIKSYVVRDLPGKVFDTIDTGANRSIGDLLALRGEANGLILGPALRMLYIRDELGSFRDASRTVARLVTNRDLIETLERHPELPHSVAFIGGLPAIKKYTSVPLGSVCHYLFTKIQQHHADAFFIKLARATDMEDEHPILVLRNRLEGMSKSQSGDRIESLAITIKAWNLYRQRKAAKSLRWSKVEDFPEAQ